MKAIFSLVALAATALAQDILPRWDTPNSVTETVITTTTVCPITSTYTEHGKTSITTYLTTSTLTITSCPGGKCGGVVTVPGPTGVASSTTQVLTTYTTVCPVTETITAPGTTYTKVYTTTSTIVTHIEKTVDVTKTLPDVTTSALSYVYTTLTSYCPVTETKTVSGKVVTAVYTSTSLVVTQVPKTYEQTTTVQPPPTTAISYVFSTSTSYCPVTETKTVSGQVVTVVYTSTSLIITQVPKTYEQTTTVQPPPTTAISYILSTSTSYCPVTEIKTVSGKPVTVVYTSTSLIITQVPKTIEQTTTVQPPPTTAISYVYSTSTSYCPVTTVSTVSGKPVTVVYTSTSLIVTQVPQTIEQITTLAPATKTVETFVYSYSTSYCPVTTVSTVSGKEVTVVYTSTSLVQVQVPTTIVQYTTALTTCYLTTQVYQTTTCYTTAYTTVSAGSTIVIPVTETQTIKVTNAYTVTSTYQAPTIKATVSVPVTLETSVGYTQVVTVPSEKTATTQGGVVYSTISYSTKATVTAPPATVSIPPTTSIVVPPVSSTAPKPSTTTSAPLQVTAAAAPTNRPIALALAGAMAVLAFA